MNAASVRIIAVDDSEDDLILLKRAFGECEVGEFEAILAEGDALGKLQLALASGTLPSLILLDVNMPGSSGLDTLKWLRSDARFAGVPIVMISSSSSATDIQRAAEFGANSYLRKPTNGNDMAGCAQALVRYWLKLNRTPRSA